MQTDNMMETSNGTIYGSVNNGVTTITRIEINVQGYYGTPVSKAPAYIKINGQRYTWVIDSTNNNGDIKTAHVDGLPITINNIYFTYTYGDKDNPESHSTVETFYDIWAVVGVGGNYLLSNGTLMHDSSLKFDVSELQIDGKESTSAYYGSTSDVHFFVGDVYKFTWMLKNRTYVQYVKVTDGGSISTPNFTIPIEWNDQITSSSPESLRCRMEYIVDGKSTYEWMNLLNGKDNSNYYVDCWTGVSVTAGDDVVPSISSVTLSDKNGLVPSSWKSFIQFLSNVAITNISASGIYGSTITNISLSVSNNGNVIGSGSGTLSSLPQTAIIKEYGTFDVSVTVTDTRGRSASKSAEITFLSYAAPGINIGVSQRCLKDGTIDNDGTYVMCTASPFFSSCNGHNSYRIYVAYKRTDSATYNAEQQITSFPAVIGSGDFDPEYSYDIQYRIVDQFNTTYFVDYVSTATMLMHFMREGRGVAFGQKATIQNCMDVSFNALFRQNVGFEEDGKFYTISDIVKHISGLTPHESLDWVDINTKDFSNS